MRSEPFSAVSSRLRPVIEDALMRRFSDGHRQGGRCFMELGNDIKIDLDSHHEFTPSAPNIEVD